MRVAFIVDAFPKLSETFILDQITGLIDLGHKVEIFAGAKSTEKEMHPEIEEYRLLEHIYYHNQVPRNRFFRIIKALALLAVNLPKNPSTILRSVNVFSYGLDALSLHLFYKTILFLSGGEFDIIQCHFGPNGNLGALLKEIGVNGKLVTMFHGYDLRRGINKGAIIYERLLKYGDVFQAISDYSHKCILMLGVDQRKIVYHPVGIDLDRFPFRWNTPNNAPPVPIKILTIARLAKEKGLVYGIQAINKLVKRNPDLNVEYRIVGGGPLREELEKLVEDLKIDRSISFVGVLRREEVIRLLGEAHLFFLPSNTEVLPVVLMEAQATGLPVVATSVGGVPELVKNGKSGLLVRERDPDAMAEKLEYLIKNHASWPDFGREGRKHVEDRFNIKKLNQKLVELYQGLL